MTLGGNSRKPFLISIFLYIIFGLFTLPFLLAGPYFIVQGFPHQSTLKCDRVKSVGVKCKTIDKILGWQIKEQSLERLEEVRVEETDWETGKLYQLVLITRDAEIPFGLRTSEQEKIQNVASRLNSFVKNSNQPTLVTQQSQTQWNGIIVGSGFIALSVFFRFILREWSAHKLG